MLALGACSPVPPAVVGGSGADPSTSTGPTGTETNTATALNDSAGSQGGTGQPTTAEPATADTTSAPATDGPGDSSSSGDPACTGCGSNETCDDAGGCQSVCPGGWAPLGNYGQCLNEWGGFANDAMCGADSNSTCIYWNDPVEATACSVQQCASVCDCPAPPPTGTATVACGNITGGMTPDCYLSCANGETCPDGMTCRDGAVCVTEPSPLPMYGNCENVAAGCAVGSCIYYIGGSVCMATCNGGGNCDPSPPGSMYQATCNAVVFPPEGSECYIPCGNNDDCPFYMGCHNNGFCVWPY